MQIADHDRSSRQLNIPTSASERVHKGGAFIHCTCSDFVAYSSEIGHLAGPSGRAFRSIPAKLIKSLQLRMFLVVFDIV